jgi:hypothetical protein
MRAGGSKHIAPLAQPPQMDGAAMVLNLINKKLAFGFPIRFLIGCEKTNRKASLSNSKLRLF